MSESPSEHRARVLGAFDTKPVRTNKGRRTFKVVGRRRRIVQGVNPLLPDSGELESLNGRVWDPVLQEYVTADLVALTDLWVRKFHPGEIEPERCTCDDLTVDAIVYEREATPARDGIGTHRPVYDPETGQFATRRVIVRRCHCARFPALLGTDMGLSWEELTPDERRWSVLAPKPRTERDARSNARKRAAARADWADEADVLEARLSETDDAEVTVTDFPGVTIVIRRNTGARWTVSVRTGETERTMRVRTVAPIARAVSA
jgi:hypothetical protein